MFPDLKDLPLKGGHLLEKEYEREILKLMRGVKNFICFKPQDVGLASKFLDIHFITKEGNLHWLELKIIKGDTFNVKKFEDSQVILLKQLEKLNPEIARVGIFSIKNNTHKIFKFSELWNNQNEKGGIKIFNNKK